jgi:hypothetical protein
MSKISLPQILKTEEIGDSLGKINKSFTILNNILDDQKQALNDINKFKDSIGVLIKDLKFSYNFMKRRNPVYKETWEDILNKRYKYIKPIIAIYPAKIRDDVVSYSSSYIENLIYDWLTKTYIIRSKKLDRPNYIEGQKAIIYFLKSTEIVRNISEQIDRSSITCQTEDINVTVNCESKRSGQVCVNGCGCVNCSGTATCPKTQKVICNFSDQQKSNKEVPRYLQSKTSLKFEEYFENKFGFVRYIVEDCIWKVDKS